MPCPEPTALESSFRNKGASLNDFTFRTRKWLDPLISYLPVLTVSLRRTHHDVKAGILKSCTFNSLSISQLLTSQNLSYKILKPTLDHLVSCKLVEYEADPRRKLVTTTELGLVAFQAYERALALLDGRQVSVGLSEAARSLGSTWLRLRKTVIEQRDRTILPRSIIPEQ